MSVWFGNKKGLFPSLSTPLHDALLTAWGGVEGNKKIRDKEFESSESINKINFSFLEPEDYLGMLKSLVEPDSIHVD